jgi:hypothetical protein
VGLIRGWIEGFLRGRYGYEGYRALWVLAVPVLIGATLLVAWSLFGSLPTIPRFTTEGRWCVTVLPPLWFAGKRAEL